MASPNEIIAASVRDLEKAFNELVSGPSKEERPWCPWYPRLYHWCIFTDIGLALLRY